MAETGTQAADASAAETLRDVREAFPRVVPHGRHTRRGGVKTAISSSLQAFLDVWEKNVPISGRSALPPQPGHL